jgi:hypothetical protein
MRRRIRVTGEPEVKTRPPQRRTGMESETARGARVPGAAPLPPLLHLQRQVGNQAVQRNGGLAGAPNRMAMAAQLRTKREHLRTRVHALDEQEREVKEERQRLKKLWFPSRRERDMLRDAEALLAKIKQSRKDLLEQLHHSAEAEAQLIAVSGT